MAYGSPPFHSSRAAARKMSRSLRFVHANTTFTSRPQSKADMPSRRIRSVRLLGVRIVRIGSTSGLLRLVAFLAEEGQHLVTMIALQQDHAVLGISAYTAFALQRATQVIE